MTGILLATTLVLRGATIVDGTGAPPTPDALLFVRDGRIVSVGPAAPDALAKVPPDAAIDDVAGRWIVPGLVDAHVHAESDADLEEMLRWGVTSVRLMSEDVAASVKIAERSRYPASRFPDVFPAAPIFTVRGGWWGRGEPEDANVDRFPATPASAKAAVEKAHALGAAEIKLMRDDMGWCRDPLPRLPRIDPAVAKALLGEARRLGMRASVHAPEAADARAAIADGATVLAHGVLEPLDAATVAMMKKRPVSYVPTMDIFEFLADTRTFVDGVLSDPATLAIGREKVARYRSRRYSEGYAERYPNFENVRRRLPGLYANLRRLREAGVPIALGTDMWAFPGLAVSIEADLYVKGGMTALEAIRSATQTSARSLGADSDRGTIEPGKRADFVVLSADPLADVKNLRRIAAVYKAGVRHDGPAGAAAP